MQLPFFYEPDITPDKALFQVTESTAKHCIQVLRMKKGGYLQLTDGKGKLYTTILQDDNRKHCIVSVENKEDCNQPQPFITIAVALIKNASRFEWLIEKTTELGINEICLLQTSHTEKHSYQYERLQKIMISAMLQSRQTFLPVLHKQQEFSSFISTQKSEVKLIAHCADETDKSRLSVFTNFNSCTILIGPEGDFTRQEIELAINNNYTPVTLGQTRLRTETAAVSAAAFLRMNNQ